MSFSMFFQSIIIVMLLSMAFILGGYISFKLLSLQHRKEFDIFKDDFMTIDQLKAELKNTLLEQTKLKDKNTEILEMCDKLFTTVLLEVSKSANPTHQTLIATTFREYLAKRKVLQE